MRQSKTKLKTSKTRSAGHRGLIIAAMTGLFLGSGPVLAKSADIGERAQADRQLAGEIVAQHRGGDRHRGHRGDRRYGGDRDYRGDRNHRRYGGDYRHRGYRGHKRGHYKRRGHYRDWRRGHRGYYKRRHYGYHRPYRRTYFSRHAYPYGPYGRYWRGYEWCHGHHAYHRHGRHGRFYGPDVSFGMDWRLSHNLWLSLGIH